MMVVSTIRSLAFVLTLGFAAHAIGRDAVSEEDFVCWAAIKLEDGSYNLVSDQVVPEAGGEFWAEELMQDGEPVRYRISLLPVSYQDRVPVRKLGIHRGEATATVTYIWANLEADRIGMNLGWAQVGCTRARIANPQD